MSQALSMAQIQQQQQLQVDTQGQAQGQGSNWLWQEKITETKFIAQYIAQTVKDVASSLIIDNAPQA